MCFEIENTNDGLTMHPYMFQMANSPIYQELSNEAGDVELIGQLRQFAATWDRNLRDQGFLNLARRVRSNALL